jgi:hyperosmotically inducible protein
MRDRKTFLMGILLGIGTLLIACSQSDSGITGKIESKLLTDTSVKASQISVETKDRVVTLTGNLDSEESKARALDLARNTEGVVRVVDLISVRTAEGNGDAPEPRRSLGEVIDDAGITAKVKARLLDDPDVKGLRIDVDTREGVVFLTGKVGSQLEKERAIQLAKNTEGVHDVRANLTLRRS